MSGLQQVRRDSLAVQLDLKAMLYGVEWISAGVSGQKYL